VLERGFVSRCRGGAAKVGRLACSAKPGIAKITEINPAHGLMYLCGTAVPGCSELVATFSLREPDPKPFFPASGGQDPPSPACVLLRRFVLSVRVAGAQGAGGEERRPLAGQVEMTAPPGFHSSR